MTDKQKSIFDNGVITLDLSNVENVQNVLMQVQSEVDAIEKCEIRDASGFIQTDENGETSLNLSNANTHELQIIPSYSTDNKTLVYVILALTPKFDEVLNSAEGLSYLKKSYSAVVLKKIRDNVRNAINDKREYKLPISISDFLSPARQTQAKYSEEFKAELAKFCKTLVAKFGEKYPYIKPMLTQKTLLQAFENEQFAQAIYPMFIVNKDGEQMTILHKKLEQMKSEFEKENKPTYDIERLLSTRLSTINQEVEQADEDLLADLL